MFAWIPPGNELNNREWATLIWLGVAVGAALLWKGTRPMAASLLRFATTPVIFFTILGLWCWSALVVLAAAHLHLWTGDLFKDTAIWFIGQALLLYMTVNKVAKEPQFFRRVIKEAARYSLLIEFYVNLRVFSLPAEVIILPVVTGLALLAAVAGNNSRNRSAKTVIDAMTTLVGLGLLAYVTVALIGSWHQEDLGHDVRDLALPIWLTIGVVPYLYGLSLFSGYQSQFLRIDFWTRGDLRARRRVKLALIIELNVRTHLIHGLSGHWFNDLAGARSLAAAREVVRRYRRDASEGTDPPDQAAA